jgi:hypothetical protein
MTQRSIRERNRTFPILTQRRNGAAKNNIEDCRKSAAIYSNYSCIAASLRHCVKHSTNSRKELGLSALVQIKNSKQFFSELGHHPGIADLIAVDTARRIWQTIYLPPIERE